MDLDPARIHGHGPRCPCDHCAWQMRNEPRWTPWSVSAEVSVGSLRLPARLVPADQADLDPATRGGGVK